MKENVLDVLMYLFENYFYDEPDEKHDRDAMEESLHQAGFTAGEAELLRRALSNKRAGEAINRSEGRAVLHTALRAPEGRTDMGYDSARAAFADWGVDTEAAMERLARRASLPPARPPVAVRAPRSGRFHGSRRSCIGKRRPGAPGFRCWHCLRAPAGPAPWPRRAPVGQPTPPHTCPRSRRP